MALEYVLITPAHNEAAFIEKTVQSVIAQTVLPKRWVIVSDGSTDGTDKIVQKYREGREWLELIRLPERQERNFAAKVQAFNAGYERVKDLAFDVIGNAWMQISLLEKISLPIFLRSSNRCLTSESPARIILKATFTHTMIVISMCTMSTDSASSSGEPVSKT